MSTYKITYVAAGHSAGGESIAAIMAVVREEFPAAVYRRGKVYGKGDVRPIATIRKCASAPTITISGCAAGLVGGAA